MCDDNDRRGFRRNRYFTGRLLTAKDFQDEQDYHISKRRYFNRCMYGSTIVCGLEVELGRQHQVRVQKGLCLDCCGREIFLPNDEIISVPKKDGIYFLVLLYKEIDINPMPIPDSPCNDPSIEYLQIEETYEMMWQTDNPYVNHEFKDGAWKACGESHPVAIAKAIKRCNAVTLIEFIRLHEK